jgi:hypothetical protein
MKRLIIILILLALARAAPAQQKVNLTASGTTCASGVSAACLSVSVDPTQGGATFTLTGTFSATVQFEASGDGGATWVALNVTPSNSTTAVTSATATGTWQANVAGYTNVRERVSTFSSGPVVASIIESTASARAGGGGGGAGTITGSGTAGFVTEFTAATALGNSLCDEGVTVANVLTCTDTSGAKFVAVATGTPPSCSPGTSGAFCAGEGTAPGGAASVDMLYANAANHCLTAINNNVDVGCLITSPASLTVTTGSGTSIGSTQLCAAASCPAGTYVVHVYVDITTPCGTSGTYVINLIYTDDQGSKTVPVNINGTGAVPATGVLTTTSTANFGENAQVIRLTSGNLNYSTTAVGCGTAGPMVGKLYLQTSRVM